MKITFWSDYACPYCYIGEARLRRVVAELGLENDVEYEPRAFELDPAASTKVQSDTASRFAAKYRMPLSQAQAAIEHISSLGREEGLDFRYATTLYTNTFDAHRLMKLALSTGDRKIAAKTNELLFQAYFTKNLKLADHATLLDLGRQAGLDAAAIKAMLQSDLFAAQVREDENAAAGRGVRAVPYFVFENGLAIPGALAINDFKKALSDMIVREQGMAAANQCGPDGCLLR